MSYNRPTNFFYRQEQARKNTRKLTALFMLAITLIIIVIYFSFRLIYYFFIVTSIFHTNSEKSNYYYQKMTTFSFWDLSSFLLIAGIVILFVSIASIIKMNHLKKGGGAIAEMLGGRLIPRGSNDFDERRLLNVIEEMSISSGVPVPPAYIMENEKGINAFAAGLTLHDSAIAVTRGMLDHLTRDELQGVIAHEFSHILNGDVHLNTQLIGTLFGMLVIGIIGGEIIHHHRLTRSSVFIIASGIILAIVGYTGSFLGRLIQCAVSRQQELLADASAVKFTRQSIGLANALKKIGGFTLGSLISSPKVKQASHLFISDSNIDFLFPKLLATHPPLLERIRLLDPSFDGIYPKIKNVPTVSKSASIYIDKYKKYQKVAGISSLLVNTQPKNVVNLVGNPSDAHIDQGKNILSLIPDSIKQELNVSQSAACLIYALFVGCEDDYKQIKLDVLRKALVSKQEIEEVASICEMLAELGQDVRLPIVELAVPSLLSLTSRAKRNFLRIINLLIEADEKFTLFEFTVQWILKKLLTEKENFSTKISFFSYSQVISHILVLLNALSWAGNTNNLEKAKKTFDAGLSRIPEIFDKKVNFQYKEKISFTDLERSLNKLSLCSFKIKKSIIDACAHCALFDETITTSESDLLRVVSLALSCPLPPFLP